MARCSKQRRMKEVVLRTGREHGVWVSPVSSVVLECKVKDKTEIAGDQPGRGGRGRVMRAPCVEFGGQGFQLLVDLYGG